MNELGWDKLGVMQHASNRLNNAPESRLSIRLAAGRGDIEASQRLRYRVFYEELSAAPDERMRATGRDEDRFDTICDHLLVIDTKSSDADGIAVNGGQLVGTYRLLRQDVAERNGGFYTAGEYDIAPLVARHGSLRFLELGRSCVLNAWRGKPVVELLWQGIWDYVRQHQLGVMFGCASFEGTDPQHHADALSHLAYHHAPPAAWHARALAHRYVDMKLKPPDAIVQRAVLRTMPPLIKGYLRLGCSIGDGAVIDRQFNTIDVLILLPVSEINPRYFEHFGKPQPSVVTS
jgi:L-ornithine Nalpha-acyltransferase